MKMMQNIAQNVVLLLKKMMNTHMTDIIMVEMADTDIEMNVSAFQMVD